MAIAILLVLELVYEVWDIDSLTLVSKSEPESSNFPKSLEVTFWIASHTVNLQEVNIKNTFKLG